MKFSIITPTYNRADLIERAIKSMLVQTHSNFEMIIIDDSSNDDTTAVVSNYLHDSRIKLIKCDVNGGVNKARNIGITSISEDSDAVTFLDSDDEFEIDALLNIKNEIIKHPEVSYFRFRAIYNSNDKILNTQNKFKGLWDFDKFIKQLGTSFGDWTTVLRKSIINDGFKFETSVNAFEVISWLRLIKITDVYFSDYYVLKINYQDRSLSNDLKTKAQLNNNIKGLKMLLSENAITLLENNPKYLAINLYALGDLFIQNKNFSQGIKYTYKAWKLKPLDLRVFRNLINILLK